MSAAAHSLETLLLWARAHWGALTVSALALLVLRVVYLLCFHPLASFRGPPAAALTSWWLYFTLKSGRSEHILKQLHSKYNTRALRISPNEIHISDSKLYHTLYSQDHAYEKPEFFYGAFGTPHSVFVETDKGLHRARRKQLNNFFSKTSIRGMQGVLLAKVERLCALFTEMSDQGPVNIYNAVRCLTVDIITELAFGRSFRMLENVKSPKFEGDFLQAFDLANRSLWDMMYIPIIPLLMKITPPAVNLWLGGPAAHFTVLSQTVQSCVDNFRARKASETSADPEVVFDSLSALPNYLIHAEATDILVAGSDTTATTLAVGLYQLTQNPTAYAALKKEIREANLKTAEDFDLKSIEQLPYLAATVKESLRLAAAAPGRLPRIVPPADSGVASLMVGGQLIPPGSIVSMSAHAVHSDESIWGPNPRRFNPNRWLEGDGKQLDKYLVTFSKGARQCLGINLAYAELTIAFAMFTARFDFEADKSLSKEETDPVLHFTAGFPTTGPRGCFRLVDPKKPHRSE